MKIHTMSDADLIAYARHLHHDHPLVVELCYRIETLHCQIEAQRPDTAAELAKMLYPPDGA